jgi:hypothetical protein
MLDATEPAAMKYVAPLRSGVRLKAVLATTLRFIIKDGLREEGTWR